MPQWESNIQGEGLMIKKIKKYVPLEIKKERDEEK